jgi:hypothetical protein
MPNWHFLVMPHFGGLAQRRMICGKIKRNVEQHGLSNVIPLVKFETTRGHNYYLGVAFDANALVNGSKAEDVARHVLMSVGLVGKKDYVIEAQQLQKLLSGTVGSESFTIPISFETSVEKEVPPLERLLSELDVSEIDSAVPDAAETKQYSYLLYWCSSIGSGSLDRIRQVCESLGMNSEWRGAWSALRRLVLLGHLEFDGGASFRWCATPPTLVTSLAFDRRKILVGQRTPGIMRNVRESVELEEYPQTNGPSLFILNGEVDEISYRPGHYIQNLGCVSQQLVGRLPTLDDWIMLLPTWDERDFGRFNTEEYQIATDDFRQVAAICGKPNPSLYRFTFEPQRRRVVTYAFFDDKAGRWVCGDYYGLRFIARTRPSFCKTAYLADSMQLVVLETDRWPMPYERALVLANGTLPQRLQTEAGEFVLVYGGITWEFASSMCNLLGVEMEGYPCST